MLIRFFKKPEYFFNPRQIARRLACLFFPQPAECQILLPWQQEMKVNSTETIGRSLLHMGIYDLALSECLWRLTDPGMKVLDIGANIGYFSLLLSAKVGERGQVFSFEPHPQIFLNLKHNISKASNCSLHQFALSDKNGQTILFVPVDFNKNEGTASLEQHENSKQIIIETKTMDQVFTHQKIDLIKIDVEGHELSVFEGGRNVLSQVNIILFEDFKGSQSPAIDYLKKMNFKVKRLVKNFWGPNLVSVEDGERLPLWEPPNYIAFKDEKSVVDRLKPRGWSCLSGSKGR